VVEHELRLAHAAELASTPGNEWGVIRDRQAKEIAAVRDGNLTIVERRSWQWPYLPSCWSEDTEVLTKRGWVLAPDMKKSDVFATRTPEGKFEWHKATKINKSYYRGTMVQVENMFVDQLITPNHRMLGYIKIDTLKRLVCLRDWATVRLSHLEFLLLFHLTMKKISIIFIL
jgi:hypothetical protein